MNFLKKPLWKDLRNLNNQVIRIMMKSLKKMLIAFTVLSATCVDVYAQDNPDVTLTVLGTGATKEEAVTNALRSAIEQAYGVFVSSDLTILNDDVVKNEIATISKGNVKSYKELSVSRLPNNEVAVSLSAVVSTGKLVSYAKSKGAAVEFAGALFGQRLKIMELNEKNERVALENMKHQLDLLVPHMFYFELKNVSDPYIFKDTPASYATCFFSEIGSGNGFHDDISVRYLRCLQKQMGGKKEFSHINPIDFRAGQVYSTDAYSRKVSDGFKLFCDAMKFSSAKYAIRADIEIQSNECFEEYISTITSTIRSLSLSKEEADEYRKMNKDVYPIAINKFDASTNTDSVVTYYLRTMNPATNLFQDNYKSPIFDFSIYAKLGNSSVVPVPFTFSSVGFNIWSRSETCFPYMEYSSLAWSLCGLFNDRDRDAFIHDGRLGKRIGQIAVVLYIGGPDIPMEQISSFEIKQDGHLKADVKDSVKLESEPASEGKKDEEKKKKKKVSFAERLSNAITTGVKVMAF